MSLINDMLKDLEARKALSGQHAEDLLKGHNGPPLGHGHIEAMHHTTVTSATEKTPSRRLLVMFGLFLAGLLVLAVALYFARPGGVNAIFAHFLESAKDIPPSMEPSPTPASLSNQPQETIASGMADADRAQIDITQEQASAVDETALPVVQAATSSVEDREDIAPSAPSSEVMVTPTYEAAHEQTARPVLAPAQTNLATPSKGESSAKKAVTSSPVQMPARKPRLVMVTAHAQEQGLRLDLAFDAPMHKPIQLRREGDRVELLLPDVSQTPPELPHPALRNWRAVTTDTGLQIAFLWPMAADVRLRAGKDEDGLQHWGLWLATSPAYGKLETAAALAPEDGGLARTQGPSTPRESAHSQHLSYAQKADSLYAEAWQLQQKGRTELAMDKLRQSLQTQPEHVRARELLVRLLLRAGQPRAAEIELVRGLDIQPRQPELVELMARLLADQGRGQEALEFLQARMQAEHLAHQSLFAALAARAGKHGAAAEAYRHAAELDPRDPRWPLGRAIALENSGQPAAARAAYAQALGLEGLDAASRVFAQERLQQLGQGE